jgi:hypothetical protein
MTPSSTYSFGTPRSSLENTPEPPEAPGVLENTVAQMASIAAQDKAPFTRITELQAVARVSSV